MNTEFSSTSRMMDIMELGRIQKSITIKKQEEKILTDRMQRETSISPATDKGRIIDINV